MPGVDFVAVYVVRNGQNGHEVLQMLRAPDLYLGGVWAFPGGKVEPGEAPAAAALRELREETAIETQQIDAFSYLSHVETIFHPDWPELKHRASFCCRVAADVNVTINEEHTDFRWIGRRRFSRDVVWPGERRALAEIWREHLRPSPASALRLLSQIADRAT
ncbi:MAG: NUDIX domain-containing protein [Planctomycetota bacterium]